MVSAFHLRLPSPMSLRARRFFSASLTCPLPHLPSLANLASSWSVSVDSDWLLICNSRLRTVNYTSILHNAGTLIFLNHVIPLLHQLYCLSVSSRIPPPPADSRSACKVLYFLASTCISVYPSPLLQVKVLLFASPQSHCLLFILFYFLLLFFFIS